MTNKRKLLITLAMVVLVRVLAHIPVPWVDTEFLKYTYNYSFMEFSNIFSGGAIEKFAVGSVGVSAYISASLIYQMLSFFILPLRKLSQSAAGQYILKKTLFITGIILSPIYSFVSVYFLNQQYSILIDNTKTVYITVAAIQSIGAILCVIAGNIIEEKGIGNGLSVLIYVNILASLPSAADQLMYNREVKNISELSAKFSIALCIFIVLIVFFTDKIEYRFSISDSFSYNSGNKNSSYLPFKLSFASIMPIIFSEYLLSIFSILGTWFKNIGFLRKMAYVADTPVLYVILYTLFIFIFTVFIYKSTFDYNFISRTLTSGNYIVNNLAPGLVTQKYLRKQCRKILKGQLLIYFFIAFIPVILKYTHNIQSSLAISAAILTSISLELATYFTNEYKLSRIRFRGFYLYTKNRRYRKCRAQHYIEQTETTPEDY